MTTAAPAPVPAYWCRAPSQRNFGDALTPWIIKSLTGVAPRFVPPGRDKATSIAVGSIISWADRNTTVWGSGIMTRDDRVSPDATILAVRGPLTRARALACGAECPEVYGDPALLLPRLYQPPKATRAGVGVIPHLAHKARLLATWRPSDELRFIDIQSPVESVIDQVTSCEIIGSSSLHGLIVGHAFGIPAVWLNFGDLPSGDGSKFDDYFASVGHDWPVPTDQTDRIEPDDWPSASLPARGVPDLDTLWGACPWTT